MGFNSVGENTKQITNCMEQSPSCETSSHSTSQEIPHLLWSPKVHYWVHKSLSVVPILGQMHSVLTFPPYFPIHFLFP